MKKVLLVTFLLVAGCHGYKAHPGSLNSFDSVTADTLSGIKFTIDDARPHLQDGTLPASLKAPINGLIAAYNAADVSYKAWRDAVKANQNATSALQKLNNDLTAATAALAAYVAAGGKD